jgi:hypothetical protein
MQRLTTTAATALALLMLLTAHGTSTAQADSGLTTFTSRYYKVHTTLGRRAVKPYAHHMDLIFAHYRRRFRNFEPRNNEPQPLYLFNTRRQYVKFMAKHGIQAKNSGGMFFIKRNVRGLATFVEGRPKKRVFTVLQHEGFHQFAWNFIGPNISQWVNEGLAQYFEDATIQGENIALGRPDRKRIKVLQWAAENDRLIPVKKMITISDNEWNAKLNANPRQARVMYAQAWSMVYFLIHGDNGKYQEAFRKYLHLLADGKSQDQAAEASFGTEDLSAMRRRWMAFIKRRWFN